MTVASTLIAISSIAHTPIPAMTRSKNANTPARTSVTPLRSHSHALEGDRQHQRRKPAEPRANFHAARCDWTKYSVQVGSIGDEDAMTGGHFPGVEGRFMQLKDISILVCVLSLSTYTIGFAQDQASMSASFARKI